MPITTTARSSKMLATAKPAKTLIRIKVPNDVIDVIDQIAAKQMLTRTSWMKLTICKAIRYARWEAGLNRREGE